MYLFELRRRFGLPAGHEWNGSIGALRTAVRKEAAFLPQRVIWPAGRFEDSLLAGFDGVN
jgi:hypothetical protein